MRTIPATTMGDQAATVGSATAAIAAADSSPALLAAAGRASPAPAATADLAIVRAFKLDIDISGSVHQDKCGGAKPGDDKKRAVPD